MTVHKIFENSIKYTIFIVRNFKFRFFAMISRETIKIGSFKQKYFVKNCLFAFLSTPNRPIRK